MKYSCVEQYKVILTKNKVEIDDLKAKLRHAEEELQTSSKCQNMFLNLQYNSSKF